MPHKKEYGYFSTSSLTYGSGEKVQTLLDAGVIDAQSLNFGSVNRLTSKLGMSEIELARKEAERIGEETGHLPPIYGRQIVKIVRMARAAQKRTAPEGLEEAVGQEREALYLRMAKSAATVSTETTVSIVQ